MDLSDRTMIRENRPGINRILEIPHRNCQTPVRAENYREIIKKENCCFIRALIFIGLLHIRLSFEHFGRGRVSRAMNASPIEMKSKDET